MALNWEKVILILVVSSLLFMVVGTLFEGGEFDVSNISGLESKIPRMWMIMTMALVGFIGYAVVQKFFFKATLTKKDAFVVIIAVVLLYFILQYLAPEKILNFTGSIMSASGALP